MKRRKTILTLLAVCLLIAGFVAGPRALADDDERGEGRERGERNERSGYKYTVPQLPAYSQECGSCHFLYLPGFLPARSWEALINGSDKHFGEDLALDAAAKTELLAFLTANAAEKSGFKWSAKILKRLGNETPTRITELAYIKKEHRKIKEPVFKRPSIKSRSNCGACHPHGSQGDFEEGAVVIPAK
ncbi:MAG: diheme cytochrome c [Deltaproteobacteria bacterium]|nr:diheme cytochrome c [Deltaproteobacteria bacterium]